MQDLVFQDTPERFRPVAEEIVPPLLALLWERSQLEEEIHRRLKARHREYLAAGGSPDQLPPGEQELWEEYRRRYLELVQPRCTPGLLKHGAVDSCACPGKYSCFAAGCQASFAMRTAKKAVVELSCPRGSLRFIYRFTLQPGPAGWLVARIQYHHSNETVWHIDHCL